MCVCVCVCVCAGFNTHAKIGCTSACVFTLGPNFPRLLRRSHIYIYIYIYICVCVCVCVYINRILRSVVCKNEMK